MWPQLRAGLIALAILLAFIEGCPIPPLHEAYPWQRRYVAAIAPVQRAVLTPVAWIPRTLRFSQRWALFQAAEPERFRLEVSLGTAAGAERVLYRAGDGAHRGHADLLEYRRVRGAWNPTDRVTGQYAGFARWFATRVLAEHPDAAWVRLRMGRIVIADGVPRDLGTFTFERVHRRGAP
ncbi:MAG: hypothetical protein H0X17_14205 [Deltaproteobacteria bacterium]|nr:hypothetical protein [Deltaproteobacteria bacterium]